MAGALSGGSEWEGHEADLRGAPVKITFEGDATPMSVTAPLPPGWKASNEESLDSEINARLREWGTPWITEVNHSRRCLYSTLAEPMPEMVPFDGRPIRGHKVTLGVARISAEAARVGMGKVGDLAPVVWDLDDSPSGIIVGSAGGGKSVLARLIIAQCAMAGWQCVLIDPKRVEMTPWVGRQGIARVAKTVAEIRDALRRITAVTDRRYATLEREGVQKNSELRTPFPPMLVVVDEAFELFVRESGSDEATKAENEMRAMIAGDTRHGAAFARAADIHYLLLAQRADSEVVKGSLQNNLQFRSLMRPATAGATARNMIGLSSVEPSGNPKGRAVMRTDAWPECEVQVAFLDAADLDRYLPRSAAQSEPTDAPVEPMEAAEGEAAAENNREPKSSAKPNEDRDDNRSDSDKRSNPEPSSSPDKDQDDGQADSKDGADPDLSIDPLDFWEED